MAVPKIIAKQNAKSPAISTLLLLTGFALAIGLRVLIGGIGVAQSPLAGLIFAASLVALGIATNTGVTINRKKIIIGLLGGLALCIPTVVFRIFHGTSTISFHGYADWALVVAIVAVAEEYFLRGALFDAAREWLGESWAIIIPAIAFAGLHVPLYGWHVLPLDFAVGLYLGALRLIGRAWTVPAIAHTAADLIAWWLR